MEQTREKKDICVHKRYDIYMGVGGEGGEWEYSLIPAHSIIYIWRGRERESNTSRSIYTNKLDQQYPEEDQEHR